MPKIRSKSNRAQINLCLSCTSRKHATSHDSADRITWFSDEFTSIYPERAFHIFKKCFYEAELAYHSKQKVVKFACHISQKVLPCPHKCFHGEEFAYLAESRFICQRARRACCIYTHTIVLQVTKSFPLSFLESFPPSLFQSKKHFHHSPSITKHLHKLEFSLHILGEQSLYAAQDARAFASQQSFLCLL